MRNRKYLIVIGLLCISSLLVAACVPASGGVVVKDAFRARFPNGRRDRWRVRDDRQQRSGGR